MRGGGGKENGHTVTPCSAPRHGKDPTTGALHPTPHPLTHTLTHTCILSGGDAHVPHKEQAGSGPTSPPAHPQ